MDSAAGINAHQKNEFNWFNDKLVQWYFNVTSMRKNGVILQVAAVLGSTMAVFSGGVNAAATCCCVDLLATPGAPQDPARTVRRARWLTVGHLTRTHPCVVPTTFNWS